MNYGFIYLRIISNAQSRHRPPGYIENHHIIPKCMGGQEVIALTAKEHWVCHLLLAKIFQNTEWASKMAYAVIRMRNQNSEMQRVTGRLYEFVRSSLKHQKSQSHKDAISSALKGKKQTSPKQLAAIEQRRSREVSEETKRKISTKAKSRSPREQSDAERAKRSETLKNYEKTDEHCKAISAALRGRVNGAMSVETKKAISDAKLRTPKLECPHCGKFVAPHLFTRWHSTNCRFK